MLYYIASYHIRLQYILLYSVMFCCTYTGKAPLKNCVHVVWFKPCFMILIAWVHVEVSETQWIHVELLSQVRARNCPLFLYARFAREPNEQTCLFFQWHVLRKWNNSHKYGLCTYSDIKWRFNLSNPLETRCMGDLLMPKVTPIVWFFLG